MKNIMCNVFGVLASVFLVTGTAFASSATLTCHSEDDGRMEAEVELDPIFDSSDNLQGYALETEVLGKMDRTGVPVSLDVELFLAGDLVTVSELAVGFGRGAEREEIRASGYNVARVGARIALSHSGAQVQDPEGIRCELTFDAR
jgi:hypothetical protein